jgi:hypothetical protein
LRSTSSGLEVLCIMPTPRPGCGERTPHQQCHLRLHVFKKGPSPCESCARAASRTASGTCGSARVRAAAFRPEEVRETQGHFLSLACPACGCARATAFREANERASLSRWLALLAPALPRETKRQSACCAGPMWLSDQRFAPKRCVKHRATFSRWLALLADAPGAQAQVRSTCCCASPA